MDGKLRVGMRALAITLPLSILMAGAGGFMLVFASHARPLPKSSPNSYLPPIHPVTGEMSVETRSESGKAAPDFRLQDPSGKTWTLKSLTKGKPLYAYFIIDGCPCSTTAEPLFHELYRDYGRLVNFVGIIGSDRKTAARWAAAHEMPYPILADPKLEMIHAYNVKHSVYNLLILPDGKIDQMWPGYSQDLLAEINEHLAAAAGISPKPYDTLYAPLEPTSGCYYPSAPKG